MSNYTEQKISDQILRLNHTENDSILVLMDWGEGMWTASYRHPIRLGKTIVEYEEIESFDPSRGLELDEIIRRFDNGTL